MSLLPSAWIHCSPHIHAYESINTGSIKAFDRLSSSVPCFPLCWYQQKASSTSPTDVRRPRKNTQISPENPRFQKLVMWLLIAFTFPFPAEGPDEWLWMTLFVELASTHTWTSSLLHHSDNSAQIFHFPKNKLLSCVKVWNFHCTLYYYFHFVILLHLTQSWFCF